MSAPRLATIEEAEAQWAAAFTAETTEPLRALLHPDFVAVHGPLGNIHDAREFIAEAQGRPRPVDLVVIGPVVREFGAMATVSCLQQFGVHLAAGLPPFVIQAAVTRVWVREDDVWWLAHLQMARRMPPG
ncbi:nuclear transport factor 2 family protein [Mycolicibacterium sp. CBM1]